MLTLWIIVAVLAVCGGLRRQLKQPKNACRRREGRYIRQTAVWNQGAAFGMRIPKPLLWGGSLAALLIAWKARCSSRLGAGLILGGGLSNVYERLRYGKVFDYVRFPKAPGLLKRYAFNVADLAILGGILCLLLRRRK